MLDVDARTLQDEPRLPLAESALAAPFAGLGDADVYHSVEEKAAVLVERLVANHPLPEANQRVAFLLMLVFLERNDRTWAEADADRDAGVMAQIAAGDADREALVAWITARTA